MKASLEMINGLLTYKDYKVEEEAKKLEEAGQEKKKVTGAEKKKLKKEEERKKKLEETDPNKEIKKKLDLDGSKLLAEMKDPLEEAIKFAMKIIDLNMSSCQKLGNELLNSCFKVFLLSRRVGLMLKVLKKLEKLNYDEIYIHDCKMKFLNFGNIFFCIFNYERSLVENDLEKIQINPILKEIVLEEAKIYSETKKTLDLNEEFMKKNDGVKAKIIGKYL